ncbi:hypothetical protein EVG20_g51 [Dentipellis fragilis]|uniref:Uncharacterized protein n=1 Tax=Dentipellis fragilis TaxID=205917 RepID=A0A4Y9ZEE7_9AGAM|nr:hypothetical protein EVG20_g51 [Dentipellis fragilis]
MAHRNTEDASSPTSRPDGQPHRRQPLSPVAQHAARQWKQLNFVMRDKASWKLPEDQRPAPEPIPNPVYLPSEYFTPEGEAWTPSKDGPNPDFTEYDKAVLMKYGIPLIQPSPPPKKRRHAHSHRADPRPLKSRKPPPQDSPAVGIPPGHPVIIPANGSGVATSNPTRPPDPSMGVMESNKDGEPRSADGPSALTARSLAVFTSGIRPTSKDVRSIEQYLKQTWTSDERPNPPSLRPISDLASTIDIVSVQTGDTSSDITRGPPDPVALAAGYPWVYLKVVLETEKSLAAFYRPSAIAQLPEAIEEAKAVDIYSGVMDACGHHWVILTHSENRKLMLHEAIIPKLLTPEGALITSVGSLRWGDPCLRIVNALQCSKYEVLAGLSAVQTLPAQLMLGSMGGLVVWWSLT